MSPNPYSTPSSECEPPAAGRVAFREALAWLFLVFTIVHVYALLLGVPAWIAVLGLVTCVFSSTGFFVAAQKERMSLTSD